MVAPPLLTILSHRFCEARTCEDAVSALSLTAPRRRDASDHTTASSTVITPTTRLAEPPSRPRADYRDTPSPPTMCSLSRRREGLALGALARDVATEEHAHRHYYVKYGH